MKRRTAVAVAFAALIAVGIAPTSWAQQAAPSSASVTDGAQFVTDLASRAVS